MRVFVTGATGFIGSAVVRELIGAGHRVLGLARTEAGAAALTAAGAEPHRGDVADLDSLRRGAAEADGVIHTAFIHDFAKFKANCETDRRAIETLGEALAGTNRPLIVTSATGLVQRPRLATEDDVPAIDSTKLPRVATEEAAAAVAAKGGRVSLLRLPPSTHDAGDHGFVPHLINLAREKGVAAYIGDGNNRWPSVHRKDAARLYRLVLEKNAPPAAKEPARYHAVAEEGMPFRDIAAVIARRLGVPAAGKTQDEAAAHFGWFAHFAAMDNPASSARTRAATGWAPKEATLIADLEGTAYFPR